MDDRRLIDSLLTALESDPGDRSSQLSRTLENDPELLATAERLLELESSVEGFLESDSKNDRDGALDQDGRVDIDGLARVLHRYFEDEAEQSIRSIDSYRGLLRDRPDSPTAGDETVDTPRDALETAAEGSPPEGNGELLDGVLRELVDGAATVELDLERVVPRRFAAPATQVFGRYRVIDAIGRGGQGAVFRAVDPKNDSLVAIKTLQRIDGPKHIERFRREAEISARLDHPNLCPVIDGDLDAASPYIVMPYIEGETLARRLATLRREGGVSAIDIDAMLRLLEEVAEAVHFAHSHGIVHRDLKPGNIMIREDGTPIVFDFGLGLDIDSQWKTLTETGQVLGTLAYMPPEGLRSEGFDQRSDVYSLGVTLFESLTLEFPFPARSGLQLFEAIVKNAPANPRGYNPNLSPQVRRVIDSALEKDPADRYSTAASFAEDLRRVRGGDTVQGAWRSRAQVITRGVRRFSKQWLVAAAILLLSSITIFLAVELYRERQRNDKDNVEVVVASKTEGQRAEPVAPSPGTSNAAQIDSVAPEKGAGSKLPDPGSRKEPGPLSMTYPMPAEPTAPKAETTQLAHRALPDQMKIDSAGGENHHQYRKSPALRNTGAETREPETSHKSPGLTQKLATAETFSTLPAGGASPKLATSNTGAVKKSPHGQTRSKTPTQVVTTAASTSDDEPVLFAYSRDSESRWSFAQNDLTAEGIRAYLQSDSWIEQRFSTREVEKLAAQDLEIRCMIDDLPVPTEFSQLAADNASVEMYRVVLPNDPALIRRLNERIADETAEIVSVGQLSMMSYGTAGDAAVEGAASEEMGALQETSDAGEEETELVATVEDTGDDEEEEKIPVTALIAYFIPLRPREDSFVIGAEYA
ncbi:MAG: serine/threonine-protein kinase [Planctomycetota bacterium]